jgi:hypothetical protein
MADLSIRLTCADYARLAPLMIGDVKPHGVAPAVLNADESHSKESVRGSGR